MSANSEYNGSLTREQFLFFEMRTAAKLIAFGCDHEEAVRRIQASNLFQYPTERVVASIANACLKRIDALESEELTEYLAFGSQDVAKQINLYGMMKYNRLVWDFMVSVIGEKFRTQEFSFSKRDLNVFFFALQEQNDTVAGWSEATVKKIKQVLTRTLVECEYLDSVKSEQLNPVYICPELEDVIRAKGDLAALSAFNCFT